MDIISHLLNKYRLFSQVQSVYYGNLFYHIDYNLYGKILIVHDGNVSHIVEQYISKNTQILCLSNGRAEPNFYNIEQIRNAVDGIGMIYGFGTGAVNDMCKYVSHQTGIAYTFCPTALSMNGISASNVSIFDESKQIKTSLPAVAPRFIIFEPTILTEAPLRFIGSAIMDSLAAFTACNDFLYASTLNSYEYPYDHEIFLLFKESIDGVLNIVSQSDSSVVFQDEKNIMTVFEMLYVSGLIMNHHKSSIAFSGGEHAIAHTVEGAFPQISKDLLHGEVISAILPFYTEMQNSYTGNDYIPRKTVLGNNATDVVKIAKFFDMPRSFEVFGITQSEFQSCVEKAKFAKERPTLLNLLF